MHPFCFVLDNLALRIEMFFFKPTFYLLLFHLFIHRVSVFVCVFLRVLTYLVLGEYSERNSINLHSD